MGSQTGSFRWRIEGFSKSTEHRLYSNPPCMAGGYSWRIVIYPKGDKNIQDQLSLYLCVADAQSLPLNWSLNAEFTLAVINQKDPTRTILKNVSNQFNASASSWGFRSFMPLREVHDPERGFLVDDCLVVEATAARSGSEILEELEEELRRVVGVPELKAQLRLWAKGMLLDRRRCSLGLDVRPQQAPHMAFLGNPGTGKTSVARVLAKLLQRVGVVAEEKLVEVQRTDPVGEYIGQTGPKTRAVIEQAKGGILFVDEAYRLVTACSEKDFGREALEEIMAALDFGTLVVILAGYKEPMQQVFDANKGLRRRVERCFEFEDLSCSDIARVMMLKMDRPRARIHPQEQLKSTKGTATGVPPTRFPLGGFRLHQECTEESLAALVEKATSKEQRQNYNGALALTALVAARGHLDSPLDMQCSDLEELVSLRLCDIAAGLEQVSP